jgi:hypothetical protein
MNTPVQTWFTISKKSYNFWFMLGHLSMSASVLIKITTRIIMSKV